MPCHRLERGDRPARHAPEPTGKCSGFLGSSAPGGQEFMLIIWLQERWAPARLGPAVRPPPGVRARLPCGCASTGTDGLGGRGVTRPCIPG